MKKAIKKDKKFIRDGFDGIADKYDFFNNFITFGQQALDKDRLGTGDIPTNRIGLIFCTKSEKNYEQKQNIFKNEFYVRVFFSPFSNF